MRTHQGRRLRVGRAASVLLASVTLLGTSCSSDGSTADPPSETETQAESPTEAESPSESEAEAPDLEPVEVTFVTSSRSIANQMVFTVVEGGFLEPYNVDAEIVVAESSSVASAALLSGDAQFMTGSRTEAALAQAGGQEMLYLLKHSAGFSSQIAASNEIIDSLGDDPANVPLEDRLRALEGKTVALPSEGSVLTVVFNDAMESVGASYEPTYIGGDTMGVALQQGNIDAYFFPPPTPQQTIKDGAGGVLIEGAELPLSGGPTTIQAPLYVSQDYFDQNADVVTRVTAAFLDAATFHRDSPDEAMGLVRTRLEQLDQEVFDLLWVAVQEVFVTPLEYPLSEEDVQFILDNDLASNEDAAALNAADIMVPPSILDDARALSEQINGS